MSKKTKLTQLHKVVRALEKAKKQVHDFHRFNDAIWKVQEKLEVLVLELEAEFSMKVENGEIDL